MPYINFANTKQHEVIPAYKAYFVHGSNMTIIHWEIKKGFPLPLHSHPHEQIASVTEGEFELTIEGETQILKPGMVAVIPPNAQHSGIAISDCKIIDAFAPVREDYKQKFLS